MDLPGKNSEQQQQIQKVISAQTGESDRSELIEEYSDFIIRCASRASGRYIDRHDDIWSESLIAFNEAVTAYVPEKGDFKAFANTVIRNRIIDYMRSSSRQSQAIPFSTLETPDNEGEIVEIEVEDEKSAISDAKIEIYSLQNELKSFDISFFDLPKASPKSTKTKEACMRVIRYITNNEETFNEVIRTKQLPAKLLLKRFPVINAKLLERHRKYIIAGILIMKGEYTIMGQYFNSGKGVSEK